MHLKLYTFSAVEEQSSSKRFFASDVSASLIVIYNKITLQFVEKKSTYDVFVLFYIIYHVLRLHFTRPNINLKVKSHNLLD